MTLRSIFPAALALLFGACAQPNMDTTPAAETPSADLSAGVTVMIHSAEGGFVACEINGEGEDKGTLVANRPSAGDWERFTMFTRPDGRIVLQAANGKYVCADDYRSGLLVADRDKPGDWELFSLVPKDNGMVALQTHNGSYVAADLALTEKRKGRLIGDRKEVKEWELFTIIPDTLARP